MSSATNPPPQRLDLRTRVRNSRPMIDPPRGSGALFALLSFRIFLDPPVDAVGLPPAVAKPSTIPIAVKTRPVLSQRSATIPAKRPTRGEAMSSAGIASRRLADRKPSYRGFFSGGVIPPTRENFHKRPATLRNIKAEGQRERL